MMPTWFLAAALPGLWWTGGPDTAGQLKEANVAAACVDSSVVSGWRQLDAKTQECSAQGWQRAVVPGIDLKVQVASATRSPWIKSNAALFRRNPKGTFLYEVPAKKAALAMAEAFAYGVQAYVRVGSEQLPRTASILQFLSGVGQPAMKVLADVSFVDDGSPTSVEVMNLLSRRNLSYQRVTEKESAKGKVVRIGAANFPKSLANNPSEFAYTVRQWVTDNQRVVRVYGSENVLAYVTQNREAVRVHLLNYTGNPVEGIRIKLRGDYRATDLKVFGVPDAKALELLRTKDATEFTIASLNEYAVVDFKR